MDWRLRRGDKTARSLMDSWFMPFAFLLSESIFNMLLSWFSLPSFSCDCTRTSEWAADSSGLGEAMSSTLASLWCGYMFARTKGLVASVTHLPGLSFAVANVCLLAIGVNSSIYLLSLLTFTQGKLARHEKSRMGRREGIRKLGGQIKGKV